MFSNLKINDNLYFLNINNITKNPELYVGSIIHVGNLIDPPLKPGEIRNPSRLLMRKMPTVNHS